MIEGLSKGRSPSHLHFPNRIVPFLRPAEIFAAGNDGERHMRSSGNSSSTQSGTIMSTSNLTAHKPVNQSNGEPAHEITKPSTGIQSMTVFSKARRALQE